VRAAAALLSEAPVARRATVLGAALVLAMLASAALYARPAWVIAALSATLIVTAVNRWLVQWRTLVGGLVLCILIVPISRYSLPFSLPFQAEPYQLLLAVIALVWLASLLAESDALRFRPTGLAAPFSVLLVVITGSIALNLDTIHARGVGTDVIFKISFFVGFFVLMLMLGNVLRTRADLDAVIKVLVAAAAAVGFFTLIENKTGFNAFNHLHQFFPVLRFQEGGVPGFLEARGSGFRVYGSAQHPLALGAALVTVLPLGVYLGIRTQRRLWWGAAGLM